MKKYPFPEYEGEKHLAPGIVWDTIAQDGFKIRFFNEIMYMAEYLGDGLTKAGEKKSINSFKGFTHQTRLRMELNGWVERQLAIAHYLYIANKKGLTYAQIKNELQINIWQTILPMLLIPAKKLKKLLKRK